MNRAAAIRRLGRVEARVTEMHPPNRLLDYLKTYGYQPVAKFFEEENYCGCTHKSFAAILELLTQSREPEAFEQYRGLVPDDVIRQAYGLRRNWYCGTNGNPYSRVRFLAGVVDEAGNVMPGYRLLDNGCIVDDRGQQQ